jgi:hypothetical protein
VTIRSLQAKHGLVPGPEAPPPDPTPSSGKTEARGTGG